MLLYLLTITSDEFEEGDLTYSYPSTPDPFGTSKHNASGPLMNSAIAMFGNQSFFYVAANSSNETYPPPDVQICQSGNIPFSPFTSAHFSRFQDRCSDVGVRQGNYGHYPMEDITALLGSWFYGLHNPRQAETALTVGMYLSNRATLTQAVTFSLPSGPRGIRSDPGVSVPLPYKTVAGTIIVSVFIFLQLLGLAFLTYYIYHVPTWTHALDALSVARIGATMNRTGELLDLDDGTKVDERDLADVNGLVGLRDDDGPSIADARIQLGGPGLVARKHAGNKGGKTESSYSAA